jgi:exosome complex RNA-binding protein Rrp4
MQIGTLIYVRVVKANSIMNPELSCMDGKFSVYNSVFIMFTGYKVSSS